MSNAAAANAATPANAITPEAIQTQASSLVVESTGWLVQNWLEIAIAIGVAVGIALLLYALRSWGTKLCQRERETLGWGTILGRAIARTGSFFIIMTSAKLVSGYADPPESIAATIDFLFTVAAVFQAAIWARELILGGVERRTDSDHYAGEALASAMGIIRLLVTIALFAIALIVVLDNLGVNVTGLVAGLGVGGIAIGLAAQGVFADLFAALAILFDRPFRRGDTVKYDDTIGTVQEIGLKSTRIRAFTGEERIIANKQLLDKELQNLTGRNHIRIQLPIGVAYETPPEKLEALPAMLTEIVEPTGATVSRASFETFGASSIDFALWFDVPGSDWGPAHKARDTVIIEIIRRFNAEGIVIAYPTQTTYTAAPDGRMIMPYPDVQPVKRVDLREAERD